MVGLVSVYSAFRNALLISDGPDFLFNGLNLQQVLIPHYRLTFGLLQWPLQIASRFTENFDVLRLVYSIPMVLAPVLMLMLSWWLVGKTHPSMFVWASLGILMVNLPGQINWIATSIRTNQLFWPVLLAILIGMPNRAVIPTLMLAQFMLLLHPHAAAYFLAGTMAAVWIAWRQPAIRQRMVGVAGFGAFLMLMRLGIPATPYEREYSGVDRQWALFTSFVQGPIMLALIAIGIGALLLLVAPRIPRGSRIAHSLAICALAAAVITLISSAGSSEWIRTSSDFRGSNIVFALVMMGIAFLDAALPRRQVRMSALWRPVISTIVALAFSVVILVQSNVINHEVGYIRSVLANAETACIPESSLRDFESSPLNTFAFPAASLMLQDRHPTHIILPDRICERAISTDGKFPVWRNYGAGTVEPGWIDLYPLQFAIQQTNQCWVSMPNGWHAVEVGNNNQWGRWSTDTGVIHLSLKQPAVVTFNWSARSFIPDTELIVELNGYQVARKQIGDDMAPQGPLRINLSAGVNVITIRSTQAPQRPPANPEKAEQDSREMTFMLWNPIFELEDGTACNLIDED